MYPLVKYNKKKLQGLSMLFLQAFVIAALYNGCGQTGYLDGNLNQSSTDPLNPNSGGSNINDSGVIQVSVQPSSQGVAGQSLSVLPRFSLNDSNGNLQTASTAAITLSAHSNATCTAPATGTLTVNSASLVSGIVSMQTLSYTKAENVYIKASAPNYVPVCTNAISIAAGSAQQLSFSIQPAATSFLSSSFPVQPVIAVTDAFGNIASANVSIAAYTDAACTNAVPAGNFNINNATVASNAGFTRFSGLAYNAAGTVYLKASANSVASPCSTATVVSGNQFQNTTANSGLLDGAIQGSGGYSEIAFSDIQNDGKVDIVMTSTGGHPQAFSNNGNNTFGLFGQIGDTHRTMAFGDCNNDGFRDLNFTSSAAPNIEMFVNMMGLSFNNITANFPATFGNPDGATWLDYNKDGLLDLFQPDGAGTANSRFSIYKNMGNCTFTDATAGSGLPTGANLNGLDNNDGTTAIDYDGDGDVDLFVGIAQDSALGDLNPGYLKLYRNNGNSTFTDFSGGSGLAGVDWDYKPGISFGDYDNDGDFDLFIGKIGAPGLLYRNNGNGTFTDVSMASGISSVSAVAYGSSWGDLDNDGDLDLVVVNDGSNDLIFRNNGNSTFTEIHTNFNINNTQVAGEKSFTGTAMADIDNDGDLDVFTNNFGASDIRFYQNFHTGPAFLRVKLVGKGAGGAPKDASGSIIQLYDASGTVIRAVREVSGGGIYGQNEPIAHFGLSGAWGAESGTYTVKVKFTSGVVKTVLNVIPKNALLTIGATNLKNTIEVAE